MTAWMSDPGKSTASRKVPAGVDNSRSVPRFGQNPRRRSGRQQVLLSYPAVSPSKRLLAGVATDDGATVCALDDGSCIIATTAFFMPIVDAAQEFGRIAATNAIADVYAMGGTPITALA